MFRVTHKFKNLNITKEVINTKLYFVNSQTVRWRKPRWLPTAKSKLFRVPPRVKLPKEEEAELKRLNNNYKTQVKSIRNFLSQKYSASGLSESNLEEHTKEFEADFARCVELNNKWNDEQKVLREKRVAAELEAEVVQANKIIEAELIRKEENLRLVEDIVRREKDLSKSWITPETIDAAIENALANPVDYNYAVNVNGEKVIDKENSEEKQRSTITQ